jgi:MtN3 and saliva related transmembrane protein
MKIFKILVTIVGIGMSVGYYPQACKIWKNKSSTGISLSTFFIFSIGSLIWFVYGILIKDIVIIISYGLGVVGSWTVSILALMYRNK